MIVMGFLAAMLAAAAPGPGGAGNFVLVNGTPVPLAEVSIRRAGTQDWKALQASPAPGAKAPVTFKDDDCAFDIRAKVDGAPVTWAGVNLCDVKSVTLKKDGSAGAWVDYDQ
ncbi:MAG TPA: hypothetical protein VIL42_02075 [Sphingomicrobium sp.]|jgi:hypothetical protein